MILDKRYDDSETLSPQFTTIYRTDYLGVIPRQDLLPNIAEGYYIGYVDYRDYPRQYNLNQISGDTTQLTFTPVIENHSWGFLGQSASGSFAKGTPQFYGWNTDDSLYIKDTSEDARCYFLNDIIMANVNTLGTTMRVEGRFIYIETSYLEEISTEYGFSFYHSNNPRALSSPFYIDTTMLELANVCTGDAKLSLTFTWNGNSHTVQFGKEDYINDTVAKIIDGDYTVYIIMTNFSFRAVDNYAYGQNQTGAVTILPFYSQTIPETDPGSGAVLKQQENAVWVPCNAYATDQRFRYNYYVGTIDPAVYSLPVKIGSCIVGNYPLGTLTAEEFAGAGFSANYDGLIRETMLIVGMGSVDWGSEHYYSEGFFSQINFDDIWKATMGYHKIYNDPQQTTTSTGYSEIISTALYQDLERPLLERENGRYPQDRDFSLKLRDWQIPGAHLNENEYDPADMPPYDPEPPGPGPSPVDTEDKFTGDNVSESRSRIFTSSGVQYYALNESELEEFVNRLWSQPKSFYEALQIAGKQTDSIFDYIESLRYYPINANFNGSTTQVVHMGTGAVLYKTDGTTPVEYSLVFADDPWSWNIGSFNLAEAKYHWRGNFLDYAPYTKITIYLPYVGSVELDPASIASHKAINETQIYVDATTDLTTGCLTYYVRNDGGTLLATKTIKIAIDLPLNANNAVAQSSALLRAQFNTTKSVLGSTLGPLSSAAGGAAGASGFVEGAVGAISAPGVIGGLAALPSTIGSAYLENSLAKKQIPVEVQSQGGVASNIYDYQQPYITIHRQKVSNPDNYGHATGFLVDGTFKISDLTGFTVCRNVDVSSISQAIDKEKAQIKRILESGFYA